jgi:hypothetical protein
MSSNHKVRDELKALTLRLLKTVSEDRSVDDWHFKSAQKD